jgi:hypothetical protein
MANMNNNSTINNKSRKNDEQPKTQSFGKITTERKIKDPRSIMPKGRPLYQNLKGNKFVCSLCERPNNTAEELIRTVHPAAKKQNDFQRLQYKAALGRLAHFSRA